MCSTRKLRVLIVSSDKYPPIRPAAKAIFSEEFVRRAHLIDWILQQERGHARFRRKHYGTGVAYIAGTDDGHSKWHRLRKHLLDSLNDLRMFQLSRSNRYDVILVKDKYLAALMGLAAARATATPFCFWLAYPHAEASLYSARNRLSRYRLLNFVKGAVYRFVLYKIVLPATDHIFVQSEQMKADIAKEGIPEEKMTPVPGSVNLTNIPYKAGMEQRASGGADNERRIVYLGTMMRVRRLDFLIRVIYEVRKTHPATKLYMLGKGEMPADDAFLRAEVDRLGVAEAVVFTGFLPMDQAWEHIRDADVCVSPYFPTSILNSTSPTKLIEYMAMGKAVVANDHPEQSLVIAESGGGICVPWDEEAFAGAIVKILDDANLAAQMGENGQRFVANERTNARMADVVEAEFLRLCPPNNREAVRSSCNNYASTRTKSMAQQRRKLCVIVPTHWEAKMGGAQYQAQLLIERLLTLERFEVFFLGRRINPSFRPKGYHIAKIAGPKGLRQYGFFFDAFRLLRVLKRIQPDVIYQEVACAYTGITAYFAQRHHCRTIWHIASDMDVLREARRSWRSFLPHHYVENRIYE